MSLYIVSLFGKEIHVHDRLSKVSSAPQVGAGETKETLSTLVRLDPCTAHHNIYGQVLTRKLQHRRYHFPLLSGLKIGILDIRYSALGSYTPDWSSLQVIKKYCEKSMFKERII